MTSVKSVLHGGPYDGMEIDLPSPHKNEVVVKGVSDTTKYVWNGSVKEYRWEFSPPPVVR